MARPQPKPKLNGVWISDTAIRQPVFITMLALFTIVLGLLSYRNLPVDLLPEITPPVVAVNVTYPGAGPVSVADQVAEPLEDELSTLNGVENITSNSSEGFMTLIVEFEQDRDPIVGLQDVRERVNLVRPQLPQDIEEPVFRRFDPSQSPILAMAFTSSGDETAEELRRLIEDNIVPRIQRAPGVGSTDVQGGLVRQINVNMDLDRLTALRILPAQVSNAISNASSNTGLGNIQLEGREVNLRSPSAFQEPQDIERLGIAGTAFDVGDVASVEDGFEEVETLTRLNGDETIRLDVRKQSGTNTVEVSEEALTELDAALEDYPQLSYTLIRDEAEAVRENRDGSIEEILFAVLFALLVVLFFFRNIRGTIVTGSGLPVVLIGTFAAISAMGLTINIMTLLALSVTVGLVIDDAIVVRENIFRQAEKGLHPWQASSIGVAQVSLAVVAMTLTIVAVFLPVAFSSGVAGVIFGSFGLTVAAAMTISLIESFTLAPMMSAYFFRRQKGDKAPEQPQPSAQGNAQGNGQQNGHDEDRPALPEEAFEKVGWMGRIYERMLGWTLRFRLLTMLLSVGVVVASLYAATNVQTVFFARNEEEQFGIGFEMPAGTPLNETDQLAREAEQIIQQDPQVEAVLTTVGGNDGANRAEFLIKLIDGGSTPETQARLREQLSKERFPDLNFALPSFQGASSDVSNRPIQMQLVTTGDLDEIAPFVDDIEAILNDIEGLKDVDSSYTPGDPEIQFLLKPERAADFNISDNDLERTLRALIDGDTAATFRDDGDDYDVVVRLQPEDRSNFAELQGLRIPINNQMVPLRSVAELQLDTSPTSIQRENRETQIIIGGNDIGRNINEIQADIDAALADFELPRNARLQVGGESAEQAESFQTIILAMGLSVLFVYMVLASQFGSFLQPFVIMIAMPLSFLGAFLGLSITGVPLDVIGMIGMVLLLGLVTKNSILLVDFINMLFRAGLDKNQAIMRAGAIRLRPILMTAIAIMMGNLPAAIGLGEGAELRRGLATIVIGGLVTSTLLTLLFVPVAYSLLESFTRRAGQLFSWRPGRRRAAAASEPAALPATAEGPEVSTAAPQDGSAAAHSAEEHNGGAQAGGAQAGTEQPGQARQTTPTRQPGESG